MLLLIYFLILGGYIVLFIGNNSVKIAIRISKTLILNNIQIEPIRDRRGALFSCIYKYGVNR